MLFSGGKQPDVSTLVMESGVEPNLQHSYIRDGVEKNDVKLQKWDPGEKVFGELTILSIGFES